MCGVLVKFGNAVLILNSFLKLILMPNNLANLVPIITMPEFMFDIFFDSCLKTSLFTQSGYIGPIVADRDGSQLSKEPQFSGRVQKMRPVEISDLTSSEFSCIQ